MKGAKIVMLAVALATMMMITSGTAVAADANDDRSVSVQVKTGTTDRMGGGSWVAVQAGDVVYAIVYGTEDNPNNIVLLTEQKRYLGGADVYEEGGEFRGAKGIPVDFVFAARLTNMIEYRDLNGDGLFDLRWLNNVSGLGDKPVKSASLQLSWTLQNMQKEENGNTTRVTFNLTAEDVPYTYVWNQGSDAPRRATSADGVMERVTFTCHLTFTKGNKTIQAVPWYHVVMKNNGQVLDSTYEGKRNYTSEALNGSIKYDHRIQGWDFASNDSGLAVEMGVLAGAHASGQMAQKIRERYNNMNCVMNGTQIANGNGNGPTAPVIARDTLRIQNEWEKIGNLSWVDNVTVDGQERQMRFQVQSGGSVTFSNNNSAFAGFLVRAAFLYPQGESICHDPTFQSTSSTLYIDDSLNVFPRATSLAQLGIVVIGAMIAVGLSIFLKGQLGRSKTPGSVSQERTRPKMPQPPMPPSGGKAQ